MTDKFNWQELLPQMREWKANGDSLSMIVRKVRDLRGREFTCARVCQVLRADYKKGLEEEINKQQQEYADEDRNC